MSVEKVALLGFESRRYDNAGILRSNVIYKLPLPLFGNFGFSA